MSTCPQLQVLPKRKMSEEARLFKESIANLVTSCAEIRRVSSTAGTYERCLPGEISLALSGLFLMADPDVYYELFGEYPKRRCHNV